MCTWDTVTHEESHSQTLRKMLLMKYFRLTCWLLKLVMSKLGNSFWALSYFFFFRCIKYCDKVYFREKGFIPAHSLRYSYHGGEVTVAGAWPSCPYSIHCKEAEGHKSVLGSFSPFTVAQHLLPMKWFHPLWAGLFASTETRSTNGINVHLLDAGDLKIKTNNFWHGLGLRLLNSILIRPHYFFFFFLKIPSIVQFWTIFYCSPAGVSVLLSTWLSC